MAVRFVLPLRQYSSSTPTVLYAHDLVNSITFLFFAYIQYLLDFLVTLFILSRRQLKALRSPPSRCVQ
ncbi:hypothetical protein GYMLUDRAFT_40010 [Collybiopsis luxurians FD-317 M1]|nr:hypothetical protein GYMLUDRAFT_40010 [Collybiopsis luxurians FD-317 M1]